MPAKRAKNPKSNAVNVKRLERVIRNFSPSLPWKRSRVSLALVSDAEMTVLNERYTGRKGSTDVLSFPLGVDPNDGNWYGDVVISVDRAGKQAREKGLSLNDELLRLVVHSLAHFSGHDHYTKKGFREMRRCEFGLLMKALTS